MGYLLMDKVLLLGTKRSNFWQKSGIADRYKDSYLNSEEINIIKNIRIPLYAIGFYVNELSNNQIKLLKITGINYGNGKNISFKFEVIENGNSTSKKFYENVKHIGNNKILSITTVNYINVVLEDIGEDLLCKSINLYYKINNQNEIGEKKEFTHIEEKGNAFIESEKENNLIRDINNKNRNLTEKIIIEKIANKMIEKKMRKWIFIKENIVSINSLVGIVSFILLVIISQNENIDNAVASFCDSSKLLKDGKIDFSLALSGAISSIVAIAVYIFVKYMSSDKRKEKNVKREKSKYEELMKE
jgi:hypothetical protein